MDKNKRVKTIIGLSFIIIPLVHFTILMFTSSIIQEQAKNFFALFVNYFMFFFKLSNIVMLLLYAEILLFLIIGLILLNSKKYFIQLSSSVLLIFILFNIYSVLYYRTHLYNFYLFPFFLIIYSLFAFFYLTTRYIRFSSFLFYKIKFFRPYFRHKCNFDASIYRENAAIDGKMDDISIKGCQIFTNKIFNIGDSIDILFNINNEEIKINGKITRRMHPFKDYLSGIGVKFIKFVIIDKHGKKILIDFLKNDTNVILNNNFKSVNLEIGIITDNGIIKDKIIEINSKEAFITTKAQWKETSKINTKIKILDNEYDVTCKILSINNQETLVKPKGINVAFIEFQPEFKKALKNLLKY